jgi:hypothetical protein
MGEESLPIHDTIIGSIFLSFLPFANPCYCAQYFLKKKKKKKKKKAEEGKGRKKNEKGKSGQVL